MNRISIQNMMKLIVEIKKNLTIFCLFCMLFNSVSPAINLKIVLHEMYHGCVKFQSLNLLIVTKKERD